MAISSLTSFFLFTENPKEQPYLAQESLAQGSPGTNARYLSQSTHYLQDCPLKQNGEPLKGRVHGQFAHLWEGWNSLFPKESSPFAQLCLRIAFVALASFLSISFGFPEVAFLLINGLMLKEFFDEMGKKAGSRFDFPYFPKESRGDHILIGISSLGALALIYLTEAIALSTLFPYFQFKIGENFNPKPQDLSLFNGLKLTYMTVGGPFIEEVIFRGWMTDLFHLNKADKEISDTPSQKKYTVEEINEKGVLSHSERLTTALKVNFLFAIAHYHPAMGMMFLSKFFYTFTLGMACSILRETTKSLWASASLHSINNAFAIALTSFLSLQIERKA